MEKHELGQRLHSLRREQSLTQADVCKRIHIARSYLVRIESGGLLPSLPVLLKLADMYHVHDFNFLLLGVKVYDLKVVLRHHCVPEHELDKAEMVIKYLVNKLLGGNTGADLEPDIKPISGTSTTDISGFGSRLSKIRLEKRGKPITLGEVCKAVSTARETLNRIERDEALPSIPLLLNFASFYEVYDLNYLLFGAVNYRLHDVLRHYKIPEAAIETANEAVLFLIDNIFGGKSTVQNEEEPLK